MKNALLDKEINRILHIFNRNSMEELKHTDFQDISWGKYDLSEQFMDKFADKLDWFGICVLENLSEKFIESHKDKIFRLPLCRYQILSEEFIENNLNLIDWAAISYSQVLSEKFIKKHKDEINFYNLMKNNKIKLSNKFIIKYKLLGYIK